MRRNCNLVGLFVQTLDSKSNSTKWGISTASHGANYVEKPQTSIHAESHRVCDAVGGSVLSPQWIEVDVTTDLSASVHLGCLPVQLGKTDLWGTHRIRRGKLRNGQQNECTSNSTLNSYFTRL